MTRLLICCSGIHAPGLPALALSALRRSVGRWNAYGLACLCLAAVPVWGEAATTEILVRLAPGADVRAFARERKLEFLYTLRSDPDMHVVRAGSELEAEKVVATQASSASKAGAVVGADPLRDAWLNSVTGNTREAFVPNDPYYPANSPTNFPGFPGARGLEPGHHGLGGNDRHRG